MLLLVLMLLLIFVFCLWFSDRGYIRLGLPSEMTRYIDTARLTAGLERASRLAELPSVVSGIRVPRRGETSAEVPDQTPTSPKRVRFIDRIVSYQFSGFVCNSLGCFLVDFE